MISQAGSEGASSLPHTHTHRECCRDRSESARSRTALSRISTAATPARFCALAAKAGALCRSLLSRCGRRRPLARVRSSISRTAPARSLSICRASLLVCSGHRLIARQMADAGRGGFGRGGARGAPRGRGRGRRGPRKDEEKEWSVVRHARARSRLAQDARDQARSARQGRQDQEHRGDLPLLAPGQGVPDHRRAPAQAEGRGHEVRRPTADRQI